MEVESILAFLVFFPFLAGLAAYYAKGKGNLIAISSVVMEFALVLFVVVPLYMQRQIMLLSYLPDAETQENVLLYTVKEICGFGLHFEVDGFRLIYGCVAVFMWMMTTILSREYFKQHHNVNRFLLFLLWTLGATMGVFWSADLYTTFVFFEIMSFTSYVWVAQEENRTALRAAETYLAIAVIGGLVMLMGIFLLYHQLGTVTIDQLPSAAAAADKRLLYAAGSCMLFGFGAKAGMFPLHIWLPKAHPVAPAPASALLSGILTKTGIYGTLLLSCNLFFGEEKWGRLLLLLGVLTMFGGAVLAVFSVDLKRTLACSSMSQIGFIVIGIGMQCLLGEENVLAAHGTVLHAINHSLIKLVLFMAAGVVYMNTEALDLNEIKGFGRKKPLLKLSFLTGALAIGGIPCFGGYVSKTLLHEAIVEYGSGAAMKAVEWIFLFSGGLTVAYMTKLFWAIFVEQNEDAEKQKAFDENRKYMNGGSCFALGGSALVLFLWGIAPHLTMDNAAIWMQDFLRVKETGDTVSYFSLGNLKGGLISIGIGVLVYLFFIRKVLWKKDTGSYVNLWPKWLDLEELLYRPVLLTILPAICGVLCRLLDSFTDTMVVLLRKSFYRDSPLPTELSEGTGFTVFAGRILNGVQTLRCHALGKENPTTGEDTVKQDYVHRMAMLHTQFKENNRIIQRSLSFGLLMFCVGLTLTFIYLIWW